MMSPTPGSSAAGSRSHFRKKWRRTAGSAEKITVGTARSVTGAPAGLAEMTSLHWRPAPWIMSSPRKSPMRLAVVRDVIFRPSYSFISRDNDLFSEMSSKISSSSMPAPRCSKISNHALEHSATAA